MGLHHSRDFVSQAPPLFSRASKRSGRLGTRLAIQQSGSSYPLSLLKRASSDGVRMLSVCFMMSFMVRLACCKIFVLNHLIWWSFAHACSAIADLSIRHLLPFLDTRLANAKLDITVYRRKTHTDRYLHFESHHPIQERKGTVRCLFIGNGYPRAFVRSASKQRIPREPDDNETEKPPIAYLLYVEGVSERIRKTCNRTSSTRYLAPAVRCTLEKWNAG